jgi:hypothetical protein
MNYQIVLFKNKIKKKIINKFKTHKRANEFYESLLSESDNVLFEKEYENGSLCSYELSLLEKTSGTFLPIFLKDELGRRVKVNLEDDDYTISSISKYKTEELILDTTTNKKINSKEFIKFLENEKTISDGKKAKMIEYSQQNQSDLEKIFNAVKAINNLKNSVITQLDSQDLGVKASIGDQSGGEGYVISDPSGPIKLVNRGGFTAANRAVQR